MKNVLKLFLFSITITGCGNVVCENNVCENNEKKYYESDWSSIRKHDIPDWLMDAKFGIYCHWGPQSVQEINPGISVVEAFDLWKGEKFNASEWADIFMDAGAQFAGQLAQHCTGCLNWDSDVSDWNSVNYGPKRDIIGELSREVKKRGMKFMASFHTITYGGIWGQISNNDRTYCEPIMEFDSICRTDKRWMQGWVDRIYEVTHKYDIDMIWFDTSWGFTVGGDLREYVKGGKYAPGNSERNSRIGGIADEFKEKIIADFYNHAIDENKEVEVVFKGNDMPMNIGMRDIEDGTLNDMQYDPWMADINMLMLPEKGWGNWFYNDNRPLKDANMIVDLLVDVTSKNGRLLLSIPPKADGEIPSRVREELKKIGRWLKINGEGIYGTNPWGIYGEGPTVVKHEGHHAHTRLRGKEIERFCGEDVRYTVKNNDIYAFVLDNPVGNIVEFKSLGFERNLYPDEIKSVKMLGYDGKIKWQHERDCLRVEFPENIKNDFAYCFKVERKNLLD